MNVRVCAALLLASAFLLPAGGGVRIIDVVRSESGVDSVYAAVDAGETGKGRSLFFVWGETDKGETLADWSNLKRVAYLSDAAANCRFDLPAAVKVTGERVVCRLFLASAGDVDALLESIKSTGAQYIDTGVAPDRFTSVAVDQLFDWYGVKNNQHIFGLGSPDPNTGVSDILSFYAFAGGGYDPTMWGASLRDNVNSYDFIGAATIGAVAQNVRAQLLLSAPARGLTVTQNGKTDSFTRNNTISISEESPRPDATMYLFASRFVKSDGTTSAVNYGKFTCYACSITNKNGCVRNYRPAMKSGVAGMYDTINRTFSPSATSTAFVAGPEITGSLAPGETPIATSRPVEFLYGGSFSCVTNTPGTVTLTVPLGVSQTYAGVMEAAFVTNVVKKGKGILTLTGASTYKGELVVEEGILVMSPAAHAGKPHLVVSNGASFVSAGNHGSGTIYNFPLSKTSIAGAGVCGIGAFVRKSGNRVRGAPALSLTDDATVSCRIEYNIGTVGLNGYTLTKIGAANWDAYNNGAVSGGNVNKDGRYGKIVIAEGGLHVDTKDINAPNPFNAQNVIELNGGKLSLYSSRKCTWPLKIGKDAQISFKSGTYGTEVTRAIDVCGGNLTFSKSGTDTAAMKVSGAVTVREARGIVVKSANKPIVTFSSDMTFEDGAFLQVDANATVNISKDAAVTVLRGAGTLSGAGALTVSEEIVLPSLSTECLKVNKALTLADGAAIVFAGDLSTFPDAPTYLLTATSLACAGEVTVPKLPKPWKMVVKEDGIVVRPFRGLAVILQ